MLRRRPSANAGIWAAIGLVLLVALLGAAPVAQAGPAGGHHDHHVTATGHLDHLAAVAHDHIGAVANQGAPEVFADALLPRTRIALPALGLIFAVGLLWILWTSHTAPVGRDPPRTPLIVSSGRALLARLCISRR